MKKLLLLIACIIFYNLIFCQSGDGLSGFLNKSLTEILKERNDSLSTELNSVTNDLEDKEKESGYKSSSYNESIQFLLFLAKLENNQPLTGNDSIFIEAADPADSIYNLVINEGALDILDQTTSPSKSGENVFFDAFPKLKHLLLTHKLVVRTQTIAGAEAPAITLPPLPLFASNNASVKDKKKIAGLWLNYINQASSICNFPQSELIKYFTIEKAKVPDANLDKLIELRQKCAMFIQVKYCHK